MARRKAARSPWNGWRRIGGLKTWANPRPPAMPTTLEITIEGYYSAAALIGFLAAQSEEPGQPRAVAQWAHDMGEQMAAEERRRLRTRTKRQRPKNDADL